MANFSLRLALILFGAAVAASAGAADAPPPVVHTVLKLVKTGAGASVSFDPASCPACVQGHDPAFVRDNDREVLIQLDVPRGRYLEIAFTASPKAIRRVVLQSGDLEFRQQGDRLVVPLPPLEEDAVESGEFATHVVEKGMVLRFEHADPARLAGAYAGKAPPMAQRAAANALEFAQREAVRQLGLGQYVAREGLGVIEIMGFDTNDPHGHLDAPPHMHMHLRWPYNSGTQIGHFYISPEGLLTRNEVGIPPYGLPARTFTPGQTFTTLDNRGRPVYAQTITPEGWLTLASVHPGADSRSCLIRPQGAGFQDGASVICDGAAAIPVSVTDDLAAGVVSVRTGTVTETLRYDKDTGRLLSPRAVPALPESAVIPTSQTMLSLPGVD